MRVTKKVFTAVLILCMMLQISGAAVIADDAVNRRSTEISDTTVEKGGDSVHAADIVSVSVEGGNAGSSVSGASASAAGGGSVSSAGGASASAANETSAASKDTFSAGSEESYAQSRGEEKLSADEGLFAESSSDKSELNTDCAELSD